MSGSGRRRGPEDPPARRFSFGRITRVMDSIGTVWVFVLLIIINLDIGGRAFFNHPIRGVPEIVAMSIVALVFMQIAHTLRVGRLTRSEVLLGWLMRNRPRFGSFLRGVHHVAGTILFGILFWASWPYFTKAWRINEYVGAEGDFKAPVWPVKLIILIGCVAAGIQFLLMAGQDFHEAFKSRRDT
jgi:TRAP-type C4-dicarboxylate transport system permease small subunit